MTQAELQQDVQRFTSDLMFGVAEAVAPIEAHPDPEVRRTGLRRVLVYHSTALDIATGPFPEINLVDMLVFVSLSRRVLEQHWVPEVFGQYGKPLAETFAKLERELWTLTNKILTGDQQEQLRDLIVAWEHGHPDQVLVEGVRFQEFSSRAGEVTAERAARARGLFGQIKSATQAADQALLISERALFLAHRMPFLVRLQARIGVQEAVDDSLRRMKELERVMKHVPEARPALRELAALSSHAAEAARETRLLAEAAEPYLEYVGGTEDVDAQALARRRATLLETLARVDRISERSVLLLQELRRTLPGDPDRAITEVEQRVDGLVRRWMLYLLLLGAGWSGLFWGGYYLVKRRTA